MITIAGIRFCSIAAVTVVLQLVASIAVSAQSSPPSTRNIVVPSHFLRAEKALAVGDKLRAEWKRDSLRLALKKYAEAQADFHRAQAFQREADALKRLGDTSCILSEYSRALGDYQSSMKLAEKVFDQRLEVDLLNRISNTYLEMAKVTEALPYCNRAAEIARQIDYRRGTAEALNQLGMANSIVSEVTQAEENLNRALAIWSEENYAPGLSSTWLNLGYLYSNLGDTKRALESYRKALTTAEEIKNQFGQALSLTAIGGVYAFQGEKQEAFNVHSQALKLFRTIGNRNGEAATLNGVGYLYDELGDSTSALRCYTLALGLYRSVENWSYAAITSGYIGRIYLARREKDKALKFFNDKLATSRAVRDRRMEAYTLKDIGNVLKASEKDEALKHYRQALALSQTVFDRRGQGYILSNIASLYADLGNHIEALKTYEQALALMRAVTDRTGEINTLYGLARSESELGRLAASRARIEESLDIIENLRTKVVNSSLRISYLDTVYQHYEFYVDLLMRMHKQDRASGYAALALEVNEHSRAKTLLESLIEGRTDIRQGVDPELLAQETRIRVQLNQKASKQLRLLSGQYTPEEAATIKKEVEDLLAQYEEVKAQVRDKNKRYAALTQPQKLTLESIQRELDSNTLLLEYSLGPEGCYGWAVTDTSIASFELPQRAEVEAMARKVYQLLATGNTRKQDESLAEQKLRSSQSLASYQTAAASLGKMLLGPVESLLGRKRLVIVADGVLQYVPFTALPEPGSSGSAGDSWQPLVVNHEVVTLPSLSTLAGLRKEVRGRPPAEKAVAVFADPVFERDDPRVKRVAKRTTAKEGSFTSSSIRQGISVQGPQLNEVVTFQRLPFSRQEAEAILSVVAPAETKLALDFDANLKAVQDPDLRRYQIVHFATHGLLDNSHPDLSVVVLSLVDSTGQPRDGFLRLNEIYNLDLPAELVVLSACQTALGKESRAEGLIGLTRGFMYAGAARVLASLWRIDDRAAAELMRYFYAAMFRQHLAPAAALRDAQIRMWQTSEWRFPHYWAAFALQGEWK